MNGFIEVQTWKDLISITFLIMVSIITIFIGIIITIMKKINIRRLTVPSGVPATVFAVATQSNSVPQYLGGVLIVMKIDNQKSHKLVLYVDNICTKSD